MDQREIKLNILAVGSQNEIRTVQSLLLEYWNSFGFDPVFQGFSAEVSGLPGSYAPPTGRLALASIADDPVGCVALRRVDEHRCEAKRLYVRDMFRGRGIGRELLAWLIREARTAGYKEMVGDTMPSMSRALAMYQQLGFRRVGPYAAEPTPGAIYLSLNLDEDRLYGEVRALPRLVT